MKIQYNKLSLLLIFLVNDSLSIKDNKNETRIVNNILKSLDRYDDTKDLYEEQEDDDEWILPQDETEIGTGAGVLNTNIGNSSDVINLAGLTKPTTHLCTKCGVEISFTGRTRTDTRMRRGITQEKTEALVDAIREKVPGIAIRTTLISGFPGETEADHDDNLRWIERMRFDRLGAFTYSHEEDTHAHSFADDVPGEVKEQRAQDIMELQGGISMELNQAKVGKTFRVLVDKAESGHYIARTEHDSPEVDNDVLITVSRTGEWHLRVGDMARVRITEAREHELVAEPIVE